MFSLTRARVFVCLRSISRQIGRNKHTRARKHTHTHTHNKQNLYNTSLQQQTLSVVELDGSEDEDVKEIMVRRTYVHKFTYVTHIHSHYTHARAHRAAW